MIHQLNELNPGEKEVISNEIIQLSFIESEIESSILNEFRSSRTQQINWLGDVSYTTLFELWMKLKDLADPNSSTEDPNDDYFELIVHQPDENGLSALTVSSGSNELLDLTPQDFPSQLLIATSTPVSARSSNLDKQDCE